jgi:hypothetical protein
MSIEEWRPVISYEGLYEVSNYGNVKSLNYKNTGQEKLIKPCKTRQGYLHLTLYKKGCERKTFYISRLVAIAFIPNPENKPVVDHIDNEKIDDNSVKNLQWFTWAENNQKGYDQGRVASEIQKLAVKEANQIISTWTNLISFVKFVGSATNLIEAFPEQKLKFNSLSLVRNGKSSNHKGWII